MSSASHGVSGTGVYSGRRYAINRPHIADECIGNELVIINFVTGKYYGVRGSGVPIWRLLDVALSVDEIVACLIPSASEHVDVAEQTLAFIRTLEVEELIVASTSDQPGSSSDRRPVVDGTFEAPEIESRDDLQDYLTLDPIHDVDEQGWPHPRPV